MIFFLQFLHAGGRWKEFLSRCPLTYTGNRGSGAAKVMGTVLLSVLSGHWRYAHINGVRGDGINPGLLGIGGTVSEDAVRLAMGRIEEKKGLEWISGQVIESIAPVLGLPWILDVDVTVKPLYGHQQGAQIGYNPQKPGRPSHVYLVRENPSRAPVALEGKTHRGKDRQGRLLHAQGEGWDAQLTPWSGKLAVLVTSLDPVTFPAQAMPKQYRDRADAEPKRSEDRLSKTARRVKAKPNQNSFDELKNQWGWGGFTSRKLGPSRLMANLVALFYNWWNLYVRFFDEEHHREAIRSRPLLMQGVGRQVQSGGQRTVKVSILHEKQGRPCCHPDQQRVATHPIHLGAMDAHPMLVAAPDPTFSSLARRKMASRPASRSRFDPQRLRTVTNSRENNMLALRTSSATNHHAHFPI